MCMCFLLTMIGNVVDIICFQLLGQLMAVIPMGHLRPCIKIIRTMRGSMGRCVTFKRVTIMFHIGNYMLISFIVKM